MEFDILFRFMVTSKYSGKYNWDVAKQAKRLGKKG
jgi:hypothetical protein